MHVVIRLGFKALDPMADTERQIRSPVDDNSAGFQGTRSDGGY